MIKYFTISEAEALIPQLTKIFEQAFVTKEKIECKVEKWRKVHKKSSAAENAIYKGQVDFLASQLETELERVSELGCIPKDLEMGLVDFPARIENREVFLCWRMGEKKIRYWHGLTEGYAGRHKIPLSARKDKEDKDKQP